jgi:hypothetical protein
MKKDHRGSGSLRATTAVTLQDPGAIGVIPVPSDSLRSPTTSRLGIGQVRRALQCVGDRSCSMFDETHAPLSLGYG